MGRRLERRDLWLLRAVAAVITLLLWLGVMGGKQVDLRKTVSVEYQFPRGYTASNQLPRQVDIRVSGPRAFLKEMEERNSSVLIDLSSAKIGDYEVLLSEKLLKLPLGVRLVSVSPATIPVKLDRMATKRVPIRAVLPRVMPENVKVRAISLKPSTVEVRGAQARLDGIESVPTEEISLASGSLHIESDVKLSLADLHSVQIDEQYRVVRVELDLEGAFSRRWIDNIPVQVRLGGNSNNAHEDGLDAAKLGVRVLPRTVKFLLEGPDSLIATFQVGQMDVWAEVPELKAGAYRVRLDWRLPPELHVIKRSTDWVEIIVPAR